MPSAEQFILRVVFERHKLVPVMERLLPKRMSDHVGRVRIPDLKFFSTLFWLHPMDFASGAGSVILPNRRAVGDLQDLGGQNSFLQLLKTANVYSHNYTTNFG